ncbi:metal ABC transporter permease [Peptoniphilus sp. MSJ-1]|uniref:Metal ABC transporter permease n=1 Tax=Peptoniphilus ovalis TaxID=2841503 RepID=A0ABS6FEM6_9FIRM|nr:iron chelate uptake ABC transporter family permease subunit [Peptoniphilus ovalis]MBU5668634.1 metal ABC transporter permease [Peptoniphilus ovalis]
MFDTSVLTSYSFLVVAIGTLFLAISSAALGTITVLKGQSLIGDAIGHSAFPGLVLAFMAFSSRSPVILLFGAIVSGSVAFILIQVINKNSKVGLDTILAVVLSSFFGLGMALKSYIQGNPNFKGASQSGLSNYIFGQAAYMMEGDVKIILVISIAVLILLFLFYKEIKVFVFDEVYAKTIGINEKLIYAIIMISAMSLIGAGLKIVGAILISSLLIVPSIAALQWSNDFFKVMLIASVIGGVSAVLGTYISTVYQGMSTGATIIVIMTSLAFLSLIFGPKGFIAKYNKRRAYK